MIIRLCGGRVSCDKCSIAVPGMVRQIRLTCAICLLKLVGSWPPRRHGHLSVRRHSLTPEIGVNTLGPQPNGRHFADGIFHDDVIKWKHFPRYWPFVRGIHRSPVNSPHKGQWRETLMFSLICAWINAWVNNHEAGDLRRHRTHYNVIVMKCIFLTEMSVFWWEFCWKLSLRVQLQLSQHRFR